MTDLRHVDANGVRLAYDDVGSRAEADSPERRAKRNVMIARAKNSGAKALADELAQGSCP